MSAVIEATSITRVYPGVVALDDVSFAVQRSEIVGLVGHNGAGKSTLVRILGGIERPDEGEISVRGERKAFSSPDDAISAGVCVVPQHLSVVPILTVAENIGLGAPRRGVDNGGKGLDQRVREIAAQLGIEDQLAMKARDARPATRRLVMIGRALLRTPSVILLDEPTAALHPSEVELVFEVATKLSHDGMGIVLVSHRLEEVLSLTSSVTVMRAGRIVANEPVSSLDKEALGELIVGRTLRRAGDVKTATAPVPASADALLRCDRLVALPRVRDVSLTVRRGEIVGLAGLEGAGCSEVLRIIAGLGRPDEGTVEVDGQPVGRTRRSAIRAGVAYLPNDRGRNGVVPNLTVAATVTLANDRRFRVHPRVPLVRRRQEAKEVEEVLAKLDIHPRGAATRKMKDLSGGNQQKALMARALLAGADLYLFDEPTEGVDIGAGEGLHAAIRQLADSGAAVLVASSEYDEIAKLADRVVVLYDGVVSAELTGEDVTAAGVTHACVVGR